MVKVKVARWPARKWVSASPDKVLMMKLSGCSGLRGSLFPNTFDVCAEHDEFVIDVFITSIDMVEAVNLGGSI